jgi:hypothetical protein
METIKRIKIQKNTGLLTTGYSIIEATCELNAKIEENIISTKTLFSGSLVECDIWLKFYYNSMFM